MKRKILSTSAVLAAVLLTPGGAFAASGLDYAMSVGQVDMGDTVNYVVEATSDGGYVAGGQTIQCFRVNQSSLPNTYNFNNNDNSWLFEQGELAPMEDCIEYYSQTGVLDLDTINDGKISVKADGDYEPYFYDYCSRPNNNSYLPNNLSGESSAGLEAVEPGYYYDFACVDYIAKFKQDGTKEWLSTIKDGDIPVAVGETSADYRLLTRYGMLYTFAKTNGDAGSNTDLDMRIKDAIINQNGTTTVYTTDGFALVGTNGQIVKELEEHNSQDGIEAYGMEISYGKPMVRSQNGFITVHIVQTPVVDAETGDTTYEGTYSIVEVSTDLNTVTPIAEFSIAEIMEGGEIMVPMSVDQDNNIAVVVGNINEGINTASAAVLNKDGDVIATGNLSDLASLVTPEGTDSPRALDGFIIVDPVNQRLVRFSPELKITDTYSLGEGEMVYDAVLLNDGSVAAVGRATASTDNYTVDGGMNGTYLRLAAAKNTNGTNNPNTLDDTEVFALGGGVAVAVVAGAAVMLGKRR